MDQGERINSITHLVGASLSAGGLVVLVVLAARQGDPWKIVSFSVYGTALVLLYLFSTLYHGTSGKAKALFRSLDHAAIYLLIAGTYTPFTLVTLRGIWGWWLFGAVWGLALVGMLQDLLLRKRRHVLSVVIYLVMGWLVVIVVRPVARAVPPWGLGLLVAGGLFYTIGVLFYALGRRIICGHEVFHFLVMAGSISHYFAILLFVA